jgi:Ring finger domain
MTDSDDVQFVGSRRFDEVVRESPSMDENNDQIMNVGSRSSNFQVNQRIECSTSDNKTHGTTVRECQICLEEYCATGPKRCTVTKCGHLFCFECIDKVKRMGKPCPKCRNSLGGKLSLIPLYDATLVVAKDTSAIDEARRAGEEERNKRIKVSAVQSALPPYCYDS